MENGFDSMVFPNNLSEEKIQGLKKDIIRFEEKREEKISQTSGITEIDFDREKLGRWIDVAKSVFGKMGFSEARLADPKEIKTYKSDEPSLKDTIVGGVDDLRRKMAFAVGSNIDIGGKDEEIFRRLFHHELGHYIQRVVVGVSENENVPVSSLAIGFDVTKEEREAGGYRFAVRRGVLAEPLAELFSYFCSNEMEVAVHRINLYQREVSFVLSLIDKMSSINETSLQDEFGKLFKAFSTRDFSWYKHLVSTYNKHFLSLGLDEKEAKTNTVDFVRSLNTIVSREGIDRQDLPDGETGWGYQLSEVAKKGDFFDWYEEDCNALVNHTAYIGLKGLPTQLH